LTVAEDPVEVVKSVSPGDEASKRDGGSDQVALESVDQDLQGSAPVQSYPQHLPPPLAKHGPGPQHGPVPHHGPPIPHGPSRGLGQPFGPPPPPPPPPQALPQVGHAYHGPPPPPPPPLNTVALKAQASELAPEKLYGPPLAGNELWSAPLQDMPKIVSLDVKCEKQGMKVYVQFDKPFFGIVFSKGHYSNVHCVHLPAGLGKTSATFDIGIHECGTAGNTDNVLYNGYSGTDTNAGSYFENIIVLQYDPQVQEVWDQARKLRCTWHDQYEKSVTFRPFPVDMLDVIRADFAGDNVGCWMQIQVGKGPWASEVSGLVKIGQTMTMVLAIKDDDSKFDMLVRNCMAHDGKRAPIQLVDQRGCVTRPKLMSRFTKIKNFGASASVLSYAHFQAFKFPDSMEVHFQCTIQICRYQCPDQCTDPGVLDVHHLSGGPEHQQYGPPPPPPPPPQSLDAHVFTSNRKRDDRRIRRTRATESEPAASQNENVGLNRVIRVVSPGDLTFPIGPNGTDAGGAGAAATMVFTGREDGLICMTTPGFTVTIVVLLAILLASCVTSAFLCVRLKPFSFAALSAKERSVAFTNPHLAPPSPPSTVGTLKSTKSTSAAAAAAGSKARLFYT
uniref:ZP domain-containing protein n=1 Tax=Anopheles dirus TaxID=7168 RepID=A0A182N0Y2_9DIPT